MTVIDTSNMIFYFYGDNSYAIKQRIDAIKAQYIAKTGGELDLETFDMSERPLSDLLNSLAVVPMFVSSRLLVVRELSSHKLAKDKIEALLAAVPNSTNVIIVDNSVDKRSVYFKTLSKIKNAKHFAPLAGQQLVNWVKSMAEQYGATIDNSAINVLVSRVGVDQWQLASEIQKLSAYNANITPESIDELVVPNLQQTAFMMTDAIMQGDAKRATKLYNNLARSGEADQKILGAIVYQYRVLVLAKDNEGKGSGWQKELEVSPYASAKAQNLVRNIDMSKLITAYQLIVDSDYSVKSGAVSSKDAMETLIIKLASL